MPLSFNLSAPLALYTIPAMWATAFYPVTLRTGAIKKAVGFNQVNPRGNIDRLKEKGVPAEVIARVERMEAAHKNGMEALPLWSAAVFAALYAGLDNRTVNLISLAYLVSRVLYNVVYIRQSSPAQGNLRSVIFFSGLALPLTLLIKSANKIAGV